VSLSEGQFQQVRVSYASVMFGSFDMVLVIFHTFSFAYRSAS
jgi:hypothetical protein